MLTISHKIILFRFAQTWRETHWNVMYMWSSQYVIITVCAHHDMNPSYEITSSVCFCHTYLWSPMILSSGYDHCILNQNNCDHYTNACDHTKNVIISCDHTLMWIRSLGLAAMRKHDNFCHVDLSTDFEMRWS